MRVSRIASPKYFSSAVVLIFFLCLSSDGQSQEQRKPSVKRSAPARKVNPADAELARLRADVVEKMKESRVNAEKLLALHEEEQNKLTIRYQQRLELYRQGLISRAELTQVQRALAEAIVRVQQDKQWITESDIAITEASMRDELLRLPNLAAGGYSETGTLLRFNGGAPWSLADAPKLEKFFVQTFGHALPISAYGQTATHDRLRFDHRDAIDVALHPDSNEGRSLLVHLRQAGIPFIAFRNAVPGAATGAHIHIGNPSVRTIVKANSRKECCRD
jgi:hypothetical protein